MVTVRTSGARRFNPASIQPFNSLPHRFNQSIEFVIQQRPKGRPVVTNIAPPRGAIILLYHSREHAPTK